MHDKTACKKIWTLSYIRSLYQNIKLKTKEKFWGTRGAGLLYKINFDTCATSDSGQDVLSIPKSLQARKKPRISAANTADISQWNN